jgi:hypothetical protein
MSEASGEDILKSYLIAAAICIAMPALAQTPTTGGSPNADSAAKATTSAGEPTGPATSKGSADHTGDSSGVPAGTSVGPGTHHKGKHVPKAAKDRATDSGKTSPE